MEYTKSGKCFLLENIYTLFPGIIILLEPYLKERIRETKIYVMIIVKIFLNLNEQ